MFSVNRAVILAAVGSHLLALPMSAADKKKPATADHAVL